MPFLSTMRGPPSYAVESLVQFKLVGDQYPGAFIQGHSMRQSGSVTQFNSVEQKVVKEGERTIILTKLTRPDRCLVEHRLAHRADD
jgi:alpha-galactosidase